MLDRGLMGKKFFGSLDLALRAKHKADKVKRVALIGAGKEPPSYLWYVNGVALAEVSTQQLAALVGEEYISRFKHKVQNWQNHGEGGRINICVV